MLPLWPSSWTVQRLPAGCVKTLTSNAAPSASSWPNVNGPSVSTLRLSPPLFCSTTVAPVMPSIVPPTENVGVDPLDEPPPELDVLPPLDDEEVLPPLLEDEEVLPPELDDVLPDEPPSPLEPDELTSSSSSPPPTFVSSSPPHAMKLPAHTRSNAESETVRARTNFMRLSLPHCAPMRSPGSPRAR